MCICRFYIVYKRFIVNSHKISYCVYQKHILHCAVSVLSLGCWNCTIGVHCTLVSWQCMLNIACVLTDLVIHLSIQQFRRHQAQNFHAVFPVVGRFTVRFLGDDRLVLELVSLMAHLTLLRLLLATNQVGCHSSTS